MLLLHTSHFKGKPKQFQRRQKCFSSWRGQEVHPVSGRLLDNLPLLASLLLNLLFKLFKNIAGNNNNNNNNNNNFEMNM